MTDTIRKRRYDAALESWRASSAACPACHDAGTIHIPRYGALPCPMCDPAGAREAAGGATP